jgi:transcriptional regulator with XRE-family HTH domain
MEDQENRILTRNREIGLILREARTQKDITVTICAKLIGTSRRRYIAMEQGVAIIGVAELEILMAFLEIPAEKVWHGKDTPVVSRQIVLEALPGQTLQILVDIRK